jgi:glucokinase
VSTTLGIDIGGTNIKAAVVLSDGRVAAFEASGWSGGAPDDAFATGERLAASVVRASGLSFEACGCGCAGLIDHERGVVRRSPNLPEWHGVALATELGCRLGVPVIVENDANAAAYGEYAAGAARGASNAVMVTIGTGIGGGIILGGSVYRGSHGFAAEIGHSVIDLSGGVRCACGSVGCVEPLVNAASLVTRARARMRAGEPSVLERAGDGLTARAVGEAAAAGDTLARSVTADAGRMLGVLLMNIVAYLDPDVIVIGGGVAAAGTSLMDAAAAEFAARSAVYQGVPTRVVMAELGDTAGVVGAALLAGASF